MRRYVVAVLLAAGAGGVCAANSSNTGDERATQVDAVFARYDTTRTPGCTVGVIRDGAIIYRRNYGMADVERNVPINDRSVFLIASMTKQFAAAAIALLEEQGRLAADDDVHRYLPELPDYGAPLTIQHLVHHTAGVPDYLNLWMMTGRGLSDSLTEEGALSLIASQRRLNFVPGAEFSYSNSNYLLLSVIVQRVTGEPLAQFAARNIFGPLGMSSTRFNPGEAADPRYFAGDVVADRAVGYFQDEQSGPRVVRMSLDLTGDGGLWTTLDDLVRWDRNFYENRLGRGGSRWAQTMLSRRPLNDGAPNDYAYGLNVSSYRGLATVEHTGGFAGYSANLLRFPEQHLSVAVLCNESGSGVATLARRVADIHLAEQFSQPRPDQADEPEKPELARVISPQERRQYIGTFHSAELDVTYVIRMQGDALLARVGFAPSHVMRTTDERDRFEFDGMHRMTFVRDARGRITGMKLSANRVRGVLFRKR